MNPEGVIKFRLFWIRGPFTPAPPPVFFEVRRLLHQHAYIGQDASGYGYGNLSMRTDQPYVSWPHAFWITGSQTGGLDTLTAADVALVTYYSLTENYLYARGERAASSESLSHGALYQADPTIGIVAHIHHFEWWRRLRGNLPTTPGDIPYGTPSMAAALQECMSPEGVIVMGGHEGGLMIWGRTADELTARLQRLESRLAEPSTP